MSDSPAPIAYAEPTVLWRMRRADGRRARAVAEMRPDGTLLVVWFVNDHALGYRDFDDWSQGLRWSEQLQAQNWAAGWRLAPDPDDAPDD